LEKSEARKFNFPKLRNHLSQLSLFLSLAFCIECHNNFIIYWEKAFLLRHFQCVPNDVHKNLYLFNLKSSFQVGSNAAAATNFLCLLLQHELKSIFKSQQQQQEASKCPLM